MHISSILEHRRLVLICVSLVTLIFGLGLLRLQVSTDNRVFYGPDNPYFDTFLEFERTFTTNDNIVFVVHAPYSIEKHPYPEAIRWLTSQAFGLENVIRVDSLANYPHTSNDGESISVDPLLDWACPTNADCNSSLKSALERSHLFNRLVSPDLKSAGVIATLSIERGSVGLIESLQNDARSLAARFGERYPDLEIYFTGGVPMMAAFAESTAEDLSVLLPAALLTIFVSLILVLGSTRLAISLLAIGLLTSVIVLGAAGWLGHIVNNATSISPVVILTLVVTSAMHIAVHFSNNLISSTPPESSSSQAITSTKANLVPILISSTTSAVSLASLALVDSPPLQQLGILAAAGVLVGALLTLTVFPVLMSFVPHIRWTPLSRGIQRLINRYARHIEISGPPAAIAIALFLLASLGLARLQIDDDFVKFFEESVDFRIQTDRATELLAGPNHIELVLEAAPDSTVFDPTYLEHQSYVTNFLREQPIVANAHAFSDVMKDLVDVFYDDDSMGDLNEDQLSQLFLVYELSLSAGQTNTDLVSADQRKSRISVLLRESTSTDIQRLESDIARMHKVSGSDLSLVITGENIPVAHLSRLNISSMLVGIGFALLFAAAVIGVYFRSIKLGIAALLATTVPVIAGFGFWGWTTDSIGLAATAIIALTVGVVVDDTAHFLHRFLDGKSRLGLSPMEAAAYAAHRVGAAITSTSIVLGLGLGLLMLSKFQINSMFGAVACLIIVMALFFDLIILPRLAAWASPDTIRLN